MLYTFKSILRVRLRRHSTIIIIFILFLATFILIISLPNGNEKKQIQNIAQSQKLIDTKLRSFVKNVEDNFSPNFEYGDKYAYFIENSIGNYEMTKKVKTGRIGDNGNAFKLPSQSDSDRVSDLKSQYGMNVAVSQLIPVDRSVPDIRLDECKNWHYSDHLPTASVVVVFHNEDIYTLMRTVHSILLRSPRKVLREVLLVDDFSDKEPLKLQLEHYIRHNFGVFKDNFDPIIYDKEMANQGEDLNEKSGKVRLIRNIERQGLIRSRSRGALQALGEVIVFLDAHCEVNYNWLSPLLAPIARNSKTLTVPIIDGIDSDTFEYRSVYSRSDHHFQGIWEWGMYYKEIELDMNEHLKTHKLSEPYESPTHAGGLFAISRDYFIQLGTYDSGLLVWGGENFELSFKVWQCGGSLLWVPCSRVGHVYRPFMPYSFGSLAFKRKGPLIITNYKRVIEVWWDKEFKDYFYTREPLAKFYDSGNISKQLALKEQLGCKSFTWFMDRIGHIVYKNFPKLPTNAFWGEIRHNLTRRCLDTGSSSPVQTVYLKMCHSLGGNQLFRLNEMGQLGVGERCINASSFQMTLVYCKLGTVDGPWKYDMKSKQMIYAYSKCLEYSPGRGVHLADCNSSEKQVWIWRKLNPKL